ncbi:hypothetical protein [Litoreibacter janthinus]|uniref:Uncharacterized protein n=1 Tax=Litoreibacter janthinus TaxID=670154 RepID=A0A1I6FPV5_9RHOB|nr:hypothetical protein [Litoreibacter janthinus]SFR31983.1 hypothetical protein SAMN04488002_0044 [Litoreibacter janthinus]
MFEWIKVKTARMGKATRDMAVRLWCHRAVYAGLAGAYGAICLGADKEMVNMGVTALYAALALQR